VEIEMTSPTGIQGQATTTEQRVPAEQPPRGSRGAHRGLKIAGLVTIGALGLGIVGFGATHLLGSAADRFGHSSTSTLAADREAGTARGSGGGLGREANGMGSTGPGTEAQIPGITAGSLGIAPAGLASQLTYLVEEEKLAHDIYALADGLYGAQQFANISRSETSHESSVRALLVGYGLPDPTTQEVAGVFKDPTLQALYDQLAGRVKASPSQAAEVGVLIEKTDIADLQEAIKNSTDASVTETLTRLESASERHLKAFTRLSMRG